MSIELEESIASIVERFNAADFIEVERRTRYFLSHYPEHPNLMFLLGAALQSQGKLSEAIIVLLRAHVLDDQNIDVLNACALCYQQLGRNEEACGLVYKAFLIAPNNAEVLANLGSAYERLGDADRAIEYYSKAIEVEPFQKTAWQNRGALLHAQGRVFEALEHHKEAYRRFPDDHEILFNYVHALIRAFEYEQALLLCERGLLASSNNPYLLFTKAICLSCLGRLDDAKQWFSYAQIARPTIIGEFLPTFKSLPITFSANMHPLTVYLESLYAEVRVCYWNRHEAFHAVFKQAIDRPKAYFDILREYLFGFYLLSADVSVESRKQLLRNISEAVEDFRWLKGRPPFEHALESKPRIRIGYVSPDYREHPTAVLCVKLFELHDRSKFEVYAYSTYDDGIASAYRERIQQKTDVFRNVSSLGVVELAELIHQDQIDILVDLAGYTAHCRPEVFAHQPSPIQISYLGYIHTLGAGFMEYALTDSTIVPDGYEADWDESLLRLPHCMYVYDTDIPNTPTKMTRSEHGLPDDAVVFCCMNQPYKIEPTIFAIWMRILQQVEQSVLWIYATDEQAKAHLCDEASKLGVDVSRIIFADKKPMSEHVERMQLADLFLDTLWVNAHTTAIEAVWQGLPIITCPQRYSSSRVAASILNALDMPELIAEDLESYEEKAIYYATHAAERLNMRAKLQSNRTTSPLFDVHASVKAIEQHYLHTWQMKLNNANAANPA